MLRYQVVVSNPNRDATQSKILFSKLTPRGQAYNTYVFIGKSGCEITSSCLDATLGNIDVIKSGDTKNCRQRY